MAGWRRRCGPHGRPRRRFFVLRSSAGASPTPPATLAYPPVRHVEHRSIDWHGPGGCDRGATGRAAGPDHRRGRAGTADDDGAAATHVLSGEVTSEGADVVVVAGSPMPVPAYALGGRVRVQPGALFNAENVIAERVVAALRLRLAAAEQDRLRRRYTGNGAAYGEYLRDGPRSSPTHWTAPGARSSVRAGARSRPRLCPGPGRTGHGVRRCASAMPRRRRRRRGGTGPRPKPGPRSPPMMASPRRTWPARPWPVSANSTGTPRWTPASARSCSIRTWIRRISSRRPPTITSATWRRPSSSWRKAAASTAPMWSSRCASKRSSPSSAASSRRLAPASKR